MSAFPAVDPIPLPAPVWLFKGLHILTLSLHFAAVEMLLGGILVAACLSFLGSRYRRSERSPLRLNAAAALARRLPIVMTYVINLGVPPLLFAQVLYGRALYTSSVLIGLYWIAVIFLLMACYWLLYKFAARTEAGRPAWWLGISAWLLAGAIAKIYSTNMTLMLRPEVWAGMYSQSAVGLRLPPHDPTLLPRWGFMLAGGLTVAGLWMLWLAGRNSLEAPVRGYLAALGGRFALVMAPAQAWIACEIFRAQPEAVRAGLTANAIYQAAGWAWLGAAALMFLLGAWAALKKPRSPAAGWVSLVVVMVAMLGMTVYRDGIRDLTLLSHGFDVWQRTIVTNWSVVGLFLALFVAGLAGLAWLISVMMRARPVPEKING